MRYRYLYILILSLLLCSCLGIPKGIQPVKNFDVGSYVGQWYEIVRMKSSFEEGLDHVTANYTLNDDGSIKVVNQGYNKIKGKFSSISGKAKFVQSQEIGYLKVSFFERLYSSYIVFKLDPNYQYAYVTGYNKNYLWLLSRTPTVDKSVLDDFYQTAKVKGYNVSKLQQVDQQ